MAVHVIQNQARPWYDYIAEAGTQLLGDAIKNQFDKAAEKRKFQAEQEAAAAAETRRRESAECNRNFLGQAPDLLTNQPGMMNYATQASMLQPELAPNMDDIIKSVWRDKTLSNTNLGGSNLQTVHDPLTGAIQQAEQEYSLNPTDKYTADAALERERVSQAGANYRAGMSQRQPHASQIVSGPDGQIYFADTYDKTMTDSGFFGAGPAAAGGAPDIGSLIKFYPLLFDDLGDPRPGTENIMPLVQAAIAAGLGGGQPGGTVPKDNAGLGPYEQAVNEWDGGGVGPGMAPTAAGLPAGITEGEVQAMVKESGQSRDKVIAFLKRQKGIR